MPSFTKKQMRVTLTLAPENNTKFAGTNSNVLVLTGLRMIATAVQVGSQMTDLDLKIFGMKADDMNALTVTFFGGNSSAVPHNVCVVETNDGNGWAQFFEGVIFQAQPEYRSAPEAYFCLQAQVGYTAQISPTPALSYPAGADLAGVVETIATACGFSFENHGVDIQISKGAYYPGTLTDQLRSICSAYHVAFYIQGNVLAITPVGSAQNIPVVVLSPTSGLIGYPVIESGGLLISCLYSPAIKAGGKVQIKGSDLPAANANWCPIRLLHSLEAELPGGQWTTEIHAVPFV